ncbi:phosphoglucomutase/phosphomannomutase [Blattabacterium sp. (Periplaneta americana) str. BPLAN]|uniref:phosphoglucosamine mutase n=1 Tax=Blattabacterium sp. (Periplaneta americana) TaxID=367488 RepID=UPI0001BA0CB7|nr:phosphoglucosamine mutase [Blattabacterium sp. (Periplaneta americana)]ACX84082.1 phosphoglucomutase/phosphomannomutase [Blattabacterium sp. (Periplaneta americana) str. BPLAN]
MTLVKSSSGIRGTLGGKKGEGFSPLEIIKFSAGYVSWMKRKYKYKNKYLVILGRDGRMTSSIFQRFLVITFQSLGVNVIDIGLSTTPTVGLAVMNEKADGGVMLTASHNPKNWNGLKMFNSQGEFLSEEDFQKVFHIVEKEYFHFASFNKLGTHRYKKNYIHKHIDTILSLPLVDQEIIKEARFKIVVDGINSTGGIAVPILLKCLGVKVIKMYCDPHGDFIHNPEPIEKNLKEICKKVPEMRADLGISVDPDVDRVVFICENGDFFGEEYTLVSIADYLLENKIGPIVSTSSSSHALKYLSTNKGAPYYSTSVGEVHVVKKMKEVQALIGGEGNGGVIYPDLRYGRDALVGIALFLTHVAKLSKISLTKLKKRYPNYFMSKKKIRLSSNQKIGEILEKIKDKYKGKNMDLEDGIKIYLLNNEWIHVRKSNTENILRLHIESSSKKRTNFLTKKILYEVKNTN